MTDNKAVSSYSKWKYKW